MLIVAVAAGAGVLAISPQTAINAGTTDQKADTGKKKKIVPLYLGNSTETGKILTMPEAQFDALMQQGIHGMDSAGNRYAVVNFLFGYGERALYEDSIGNLMVMTDYISDYCDGDTLNIVFQRNRIYDRTKGGDTVYFDEIRMRAADGSAVEGRPMRVALTR